MLHGVGLLGYNSVQQWCVAQGAPMLQGGSVASLLLPAVLRMNPP